VNFVIIILVKFFFFSVRNLKEKCGLSEEPLLMSSAFRASALSLGFLMGYILYKLMTSHFRSCARKIGFLSHWDPYAVISLEAVAYS